MDFRNYLNDYSYRKIRKQNYFEVRDAGFNTIYADNLSALADLCKLVNDVEWERYHELSRKVTQSIIDVMYDEDTCAFYDVYGMDSRQIKIPTPTIFHPIVLDGVPDTIVRRVVETHLVNGSEFRTPYPLPSVSVAHPSFNPAESMYLWRGPTWVLNNWFLHQYLFRKGYNAYCELLVRTVSKLIAGSGFREYYNPFTGEGYGAEDFTWSCLVVDMIQTRQKLISDSARASDAGG